LTVVEGSSAASDGTICPGGIGTAEERLVGVRPTIVCRPADPGPHV